jgi:MFS family permease
MSDSKVLTRPPVARPRTAGRLPRSAGFAAVTAILVLFQAVSSAPAPLYVVYQRLWGFSSATLTLIFAIFVFGLLSSLLVLGGLSDFLGRRPVLAASIAAESAALVVFLLAGNVTALLIARLVQGVATGMVLPALGATIVDFNPPHAPGRAAAVSGVVPIGGLAVGALVCSSLVQYAPDPTRLVWALLLGAMALAFVAVLALPEPSARQPGAVRSLAPRLGVPRRFRGDVYALVPVIVASWALGGLYLSLGPSVAVTVFGVTSHFLGGLVVVLLCGTGAVTAFVLRGWPATVVLRISMTTLAAGTALTLAGMLSGSVAAALAGTVVSGIGYGASGLAAFGSMARIAGPADPAGRGELFAVAYTVAFLAFSLPAVAAGYATTRIGLPATVAVYSVLVIVIAVAAFAVQEARSARRGRAAPR